jgi:predicted Zn finger-like uncharacterized protein
MVFSRVILTYSPTTITFSSFLVFVSITTATMTMTLLWWRPCFVVAALFLLCDLPAVRSFTVSSSISTAAAAATSSAASSLLGRTTAGMKNLESSSSSSSWRLRSTPLSLDDDASTEEEDLDDIFESIIPPSPLPAATTAMEVPPEAATLAVATTETAVETTAEKLPNTYVRCANCQAVYALSPDDVGNGRRLECSLCGHAWYQSKDRILSLNEDFMTLIPINQRELDRIEMNRQEGKPLKFVGDKKLYVGNVAFEAHEEDFFKVFGQFGIVGDVSLVRDDAGKIRGYGFVTMRTAEAADLALQKAHGLCIRGRELAVRESTNA